MRSPVSGWVAKNPPPPEPEVCISHVRVSTMSCGDLARPLQELRAVLVRRVLLLSAVRARHERARDRRERRRCRE